MWPCITPLGNVAMADICAQHPVVLTSLSGDGSPGHCYLCVGKVRHHWPL